MKQTDVDAMMRGVAPIVRSYVEKSVAPLLARIAELEARPLPKDISGISTAQQNRDGHLVFLLTDGKSIDVGKVAGRDGVDGTPGAKGDPGERGENGEPGERGSEGPAGAPGNDADVSAIEKAIAGSRGFIAEAVADAISEIEMPQPKQVDWAEVAKLIEAEVAKIPRAENGADGVGLAGFVIDREGHLIGTLTDGTTKDLGPVVGKDGAPGQNGSDGRDGANGEPGLGFDDMEETIEDGGRVIVRRYARGDQVKEFRHAVSAMIYQGIYKEGSAYTPGDTVTWGGSLWHCNAPTGDKPGEGSKDWTLATKRGRDGKPGDKGDKGDPGNDGRAGRDLTQLGPDGSKWG